MGACVYAGVCVFQCLRRLQIKAGCLPLSLFHLILWVRVCHCRSSGSVWPVSSRDPSASASIALVFQACAAMSVFHRVAGKQTQVLVFTEQALNWLSAHRPLTDLHQVIRECFTCRWVCSERRGEHNSCAVLFHLLRQAGRDWGADQGDGARGKEVCWAAAALENRGPRGHEKGIHRKWEKSRGDASFWTALATSHEREEHTSLFTLQLLCNANPSIFMGYTPFPGSLFYLLLTSHVG